jgi:DNA-binding beta-propeller fold protein YncE
MLEERNAAMRRRTPKDAQGRILRLLAGAAALVVVACTTTPNTTVTEDILVYPPPPEQPRYYYERTIQGSADVAEETAMARLRQFATGENDRTRGLSKPFDVVATHGRIYVGDTVSRKIHVFDFTAKQYSAFGTEGIGKLAKPLGMAADGLGRIYVCDGTSKRVLVYDADGKYLKALGGGEHVKRPSGVAVNADGSRIYVVDTGGVDNLDHAVRAFDGDGNHLFDIGLRGKEPGEFNLPLMADVGPDGKLYVVDTGNFRVQVFSPDGEFLTAFGSSGRRPGQFSHPKGIAVDGAGKVFVADTAFGNFQIFNDEGKILLFVGDRDERGGPGKFILPAGIDVDADGRVYVVDQFFRKVDVFRPAELPEDAPIGGAGGQSDVAKSSL